MDKMMTEETNKQPTKRFCECGCNQEVSGLNHTTHEPIKFKKGHNMMHRLREQHPSWKGGRKLDMKGYVLVLEPSHPRAHKDHYIHEHIVIMEQKIGRPLESYEEVHHINHIRSDNRPENLQLVRKGEHQSLHSRGRFRDMSNRKCVDCKRGITEIGRIWLKADTDKFRCPACHQRRDPYKTHKVRTL